MSGRDGGSLSNCERQFIVQTFIDDYRIDGRSLQDHRDLTIEFGQSPGTALVSLGSTKALARTSCSLGSPRDARPKEGVLFVNADMSPLAAAVYDSNAGGAAMKANERQVELTRLMERLFKESGCLNTEALCVRAGKLVWHIRLDMHIVDDDGSLADCASVAACASLAHFRLPQVTCTGRTQVHVHSVDEREPIALYLYHMPACVTFGYGEHAPSAAVTEPSGREEAALHGAVVVAANKRKELCALHCTGRAMRLEKAELLRCASRANRRVAVVTEYLDNALKQHAQSLHDAPSESSRLGAPTGFALAMSQRRLGRTTVLRAQECIFPRDKEVPLGLDSLPVPQTTGGAAAAAAITSSGKTAQLGKAPKASMLMSGAADRSEDVLVVKEIVKSVRKDGHRSKSGDRNVARRNNADAPAAVKDENRDSLLDDIEADVVMLSGSDLQFAAGATKRPDKIAPPVVHLTVAPKSRKKKKGK